MELGSGVPWSSFQFQTARVVGSTWLVLETREKAKIELERERCSNNEGKSAHGVSPHRCIAEHFPGQFNLCILAHQ